MQAKSLLIPIAAFALSATGVSAFNSDILQKAGLTREQISAFEEARELRKEGDVQKAREVLEDAGIDLKTMESVREAMHAYKQGLHTAIDEAIEAYDYVAFKKTIADTPLADIITTEADFELFVQAHRLHKEGEHAQARALMDELGMDDLHKNMHTPHMNHMLFGHHPPFLSE